MGISVGGHSGCGCGACRPMPLRAPAQRENLGSAPPESGEAASGETLRSTRNLKRSATKPETAEAASSETSPSNAATPKPAQQAGSADRYTPAEKKLIEELKTRDREVRAHEAAHKSAAGSLARGAPSYTYQRGPDGVNYAVGGEVQIDLSAVPGNPEATIRKAQQIRAAALAPAQPSAQDYAIASHAVQMAAEAQRQMQTGASADNSTKDSTSQNVGRADAAQTLPVREASGGNPDARITAYQRTQREALPPGQRLAEIA